MKRALQIALILIATAQIGLSYHLLGARTIDGTGDVAASLAVVVGFGQVAGIATGRSGRWALGLAVQVVAIAAPLTFVRGYEPALYLAWLALLSAPAALAIEAVSDRIGPHPRVVALVAGGPAGALALVVALLGTSPTWPTDALLVVSGAAAGLGLLAATIVIVGLARSSTSTPSRRSGLMAIGAPVGTWALATAALVAVAIVDDQTFEQTAIVFVSGRTTWVYLISVIQLLAVTALVAGILWDQVLDPRLRQADVEAAASILTPAGLVRYVQTALADPSAQVLYRSEPDRWIDMDGASATIEPDDQRLLIVITDGPEVLGALVCDRSLATEHETVELVASTIGLGLAAGRQVARARHQAEQARLLTARLVLTADDARNQLLGALRDGPLRDLEAVEERIAAGEELVRVASALKDVAEQVRAISHGLIPAALERGGLAAALTDAEEVPRRRLPPAVEVTAFLAAEGDAMASLRDEGDTLTITLAAPPADPMLLDRVSVLGGTVTDRTISIPLGA